LSWWLIVSTALYVVDLGDLEISNTGPNRHLIVCLYTNCWIHSKHGALHFHGNLISMCVRHQFGLQ